MSLKVNCNYLQPQKKKNASIRLNRIEGQIRGIKKLIEDGKSCREILNQVASVEKAMVGVKKVILRNYLETCAATAIKSAKNDGIYDELMEVFYQYS